MLSYSGEPYQCRELTKMDWKENIEKKLRENTCLHPMDRLSIMAIIQTEIIEKLIEDIPDIMHVKPITYSRASFNDMKTFKQQLRDKWL